ncbi:hypothetical protein NI17_014135 [Thermobifida halotolerans]|uniref:Uncharacterized protein n=1 Tax=Thermobifida halotolerans TaxID=483545 RepID=A0A399G405_9ACTN|nr:hypothetical protein [Thermobifida halotolerans]UOE17996.1 hypothetical protein NI17_014135 [Thermobifida halotolerans]
MALLADVPSTGHLGDARARRFPLGGDDLAAQTGEFIDFAAHHVTHGRKVVALYPRWQGGRAERAVRFARGALRTDHIAAVPVDVSPLALSLLADQVAYLAPYLPAGLVAELADELASHVLAGGWLRSVANLSTIPITVKQHMGSFAPGVAFLAFCAPVKRVGRVKKTDPAANIPFLPVNPVQILVSAGGDADRTAFDTQFLPVVGATAMRELPEQPLGATYWGSPRYVEFVVFSAHQDALAHPVRALRSTTCAWCGERVVGPRCRFCGAANQTPAGRPPAHRGAAPPLSSPSAPPAAAPPRGTPPSPSGPPPPSGPRVPGPPPHPSSPAGPPSPPEANGRPRPQPLPPSPVPRTETGPVPEYRPAR